MIDVKPDEIDRESTKRSVFPGFSDKLESLYRIENINEQRLLLIISWIVGVSLSDTIIISDYFVAKDAFTAYFIGRFFVCTPICALLIYGISRKNAFYETFVGLVPLTLTAMLSILLILSHGAYRSDYLFGDLLVMICGCAISRPRIRYAVPTVFAQYIMYQTVVLTSDIVVPESLIIASMFGLCGVVLSLITSYALEQISRRAFLLSLRVRLLNQELKGMTLTDPLTRLGNRRRYDEATERFWAASSGNPALASFILIDLDRFKSFNDNYGHSAGDLCLSTAARCVAGELHDDRHIAVRFGGEEFLVFLPDVDFTEARRIAEQIRLAILAAAIPHPAVAPDALVSASLGVATSLTSECSPAELVIRADIALYAAKHNGRNRIWPPLGLAAPRPTDHGLATPCESSQAA